MIVNYILSFLRHIRRNKIFSILNLLGLSVGMAAFMLLLQFVIYENSFDEFHQNCENIYRVRYDGYKNGQRMFACAAAVPAVGPAMKNNFPEVLEYSWAFPFSGVLTNDQNVSYHERKIQIATPSFLSMLDWGDDSFEEFILQPLEDIHLHFDLLQESEPEEQGDSDSVMILIIIALAVLGIAWINYINLASCRDLPFNCGAFPSIF